MSVELFIEAQKRRIEKNLYDASIDLLETMSDRIFVENKDIKGNKYLDIKPYDTNALSISRSAIPREAGRKSKSGKTRYFEGGYAEMKKEVGRPPLKLFGNLETSWNNSLRQVESTLSEDPYEFTMAVPKEDSLKIEGHFADFFRVSETELNQFKLNVIRND